jgi:uncharacterized protein YdeI (YjbR/CyaY-like superfamily)
VKPFSVSSGVVHKVPADVRTLLTSKPKIHLFWEDITPLARNEWLCWIESAKQLETRNRRMSIMVDKLTRGERRPCCWAGCGHR